jgi:Tat protein translocase TatB subunit
VLVNLDPEKLLVLFVIALLVLGPQRLPQAARTLGRGLAEVRKYTTGFQSELRDVLAEPRAVINAAVQEADLHSIGSEPDLAPPVAAPDGDTGPPSPAPDDPSLN